MVTYVLWSAVVWTLKGFLYTWRFFWVNPYCSIKPASWISHEIKSENFSSGKHLTESGRRIRKESERSGVLHKRLLKAESEIQELKAEIASQRASWETRFLELQRRQHDLRDQIAARSGVFHKAVDSNEVSEFLPELNSENGRSLEEKKQESSSGLNQIEQLRGPDMSWLRDGVYSQGQKYTQGSVSNTADSRSASALSVCTSVGSWRSGTGPHRVFVPHSPMDLQIGHKVRILLPSGRISTGILRYLGHLPGSTDINLGVELEIAENGQQTGVYEGQSYFDCKPGHGAFVAFNKLLMAWE